MAFRCAVPALDRARVGDGSSGAPRTTCGTSGSKSFGRTGLFMLLKVVQILMQQHFITTVFDVELF